MQVQRYSSCYGMMAWSLLNAVLVLIALHPVVSQNEHLIPDHCEMRKPKSDGNCETIRRWFLHETRGCKAFGICLYQTPELDNQTGINYFTSKESCQRSCMQGIVCPQLPPPEHGNVTSDGIIGWGGSVTYSCNEGYALVGTKERECQKSALWSGTEPTCEKQCPSPPQVQNGTIAPVHNYYNQGTRVFIYCAEGYHSNVTERVCQAGGVWSGIEPKCEFQTQLCPEPALIDKGKIVAPDRSVGKNASYTCFDDSILIGNATRTCNSDAQWEGEAPVCWKLSLKHIAELEMVDITNGTLTLPINSRNVEVNPVSSHPNPFSNVIPVWFFNGDVLREMEHPHGSELHEQNLIFSRILESREQEGNYTLKIGSFSVSFRLVVVEVSTPPASVIKPELIILPSDETKSVGENVRFSCVFTGCPSPNVTWFHKDTALSSGGRVEVEVYMHHRLTICHLNINNISEVDTGPYKCVGDNLGGNTSSETVDLQLNVAVQTKSLTKRAVSDSSSERSAESSLCKQTSDPESVTVVVTAKKELRRVRRSKQLRSFRFEINRVLRDTTSQSSSNLLNKKTLRAIILDSNDSDSTTHLKANSKYILNGRMANDILYISGPQYMHQYSAQLESHIQSC